MGVVIAGNHKGTDFVRVDFLLLLKVRGTTGDKKGMCN